ncbi:hypothetical protein [Bradyrhizobium sp. 170]|uniref:hypothetical protein n=1 Tax=Bradyrhizobium sp. 170 TaxID=2782641 RepID=UPI001FFFC9F2|nr:hypothetical protein [Bradyrhizobium sp. 170]
MEIRQIQRDAARIGDKLDRPEGIDVGKLDDRKCRRGLKALELHREVTGGANLRMPASTGVVKSMLRSVACVKISAGLHGRQELRTSLRNISDCRDNPLADSSALDAVTSAGRAGPGSGRPTHPNPLYLLKRNANCFAAIEAIMWRRIRTGVPGTPLPPGSNRPYEHHHGHDERAEART